MPSAALSPCLPGRLALVAIAGAVTGKGRVQRAADLAAISAARSMRDDLPRLLSPPALPNGLPNPAHLDKPAYLARARTAALAAGRANGVAPDRLRAQLSRLRLLRCRCGRRRSSSLALEIGAGAARSKRRRSPKPPRRRARLRAARRRPAAAATAARSSTERGRGCGRTSLPPSTAWRRPPAAPGISLLVVSGFRSDAEQAALFAAHPDPTWVAPPGHSLHRCATELDLGPDPPTAGSRRNASRFGFVQRYSWEAWHYGFEAGPPPCSEAGNARERDRGRGRALRRHDPAGFVPGRFRDPLIDAATRWNVSAALLAAQLMAESSFDPFAVSPAGAQGIAQFMPGTAASYGLDDPFDPVARDRRPGAPDVRPDPPARLPELALAAYNAGPGAVEACHCVPPYPETQAYVTRILALLGGAGALAVPSFEVRLVA